MAAPQTHYGVSGLNTAPHPVVAVPPGALSEAINVAIRRAGMVEPRPGFKPAASQLSTSVVKIVPFDGDYFCVDASGAVHWSSNTLVTDLTFTKHQSRGVEARKNLYVTGSDAVRKMSTSGDASAPLAGVPAPVCVSDNGAGPVAGVAVGFGAVAYRALIRRIDANGLVRRSAPCGRFVYNNDSGVGVFVNPSIVVTLHLSSDVAAGDVVEVYRSVLSTTLPVPDELFYAFEHTLDNTEITAGFTAYLLDSVPDAQLGAALYTNGSQEGIQRANARPPHANDLALFGGSLFAANIQWPATATISWKHTLADLGGSATGVGKRTYTGRRTNGSNQITLMSSTVGLKVGQVLADATSWSGTSPVTISAISGTTLTMSWSWTGGSDGANVSLTFWDSIRINTGADTKYYPVMDGSEQVAFCIGAGSAVGLPLRTQTNSNTFALPLDDSIMHTASTGFHYSDYPALALTQLHPMSAAFYVCATHGSEYNPPLAEPGASLTLGLHASQDIFPNGLTWSKQDEPEHFVRSNLWLVGSAKSPIVRVLPLRDGLYIFKGRGDGLYRLSGFGELSGWRVEQLDPTTHLAHPELACTLEEDIYAWTNTGMCRINSQGQDMLSGPILDLTGAQEIALDPEPTYAKAYAFGASNLPDHEVIFGLPADNTDSAVPANVWVYNVFTKAWYEWFDVTSRPSTMVLNPATNLLLAGYKANGYVGTARNSTDTVFNADAEYAITLTTVAGTSVTIAGGSGWTPSPGDLISQFGSFAVVDTAADATHFTVAYNGSDTLTGEGSPAIAYSGYTARVTWLPLLEPTGAVLKKHTALLLHWDDTYGLFRWSQIATGPRGNSATLNYTRAFSRSAHPRAETRALLPRSVALDSQIYPTLTVRSADARWRATGLSVLAEPVSTRVAR